MEQNARATISAMCYISPLTASLLRLDWFPENIIAPCLNTPSLSPDVSSVLAPRRSSENIKIS